jgi:hypothetical protein
MSCYTVCMNQFCKQCGKDRGAYDWGRLTEYCITCFNKRRAGSSHPSWKGESAGYSAIHLWVRRRMIRPTACPQCGTKESILDLANISQKYLRDLSDWHWLCRKCHMSEDGRNGKRRQDDSVVSPVLKFVRDENKRNYRNRKETK